MTLVVFTVTHSEKYFITITYFQKFVIVTVIPNKSRVVPYLFKVTMKK